MFRKHLITLKSLLIGASTLIGPSMVQACPDIDGLLDLNCDGRVQIIAFGDSITRGEKDELGYGYPGRLQILFPNTVIYNFGRDGEKTPDGRYRASSRFAQYNSSDFAIILEGVNDYWVEHHSSSRTRDNLLSMVRSSQNTGALTLLGKLTDIRRDFQRSWVYSVNGAIGPFTSLDFFSLGQGIISSDRLHPKGSGYQQMAQLIATQLFFLTQTQRPSDRDHDGIYDFAEPRFLTNADVADSDSDGLTDGQEVFAYHSNPLLIDTDSDGYDDPLEVSIGANPSDPKPTPPQINSVVALPES